MHRQAVCGRQFDYIDRQFVPTTVTYLRRVTVLETSASGSRALTRRPKRDAVPWRAVIGGVHICGGLVVDVAL